ncbi:MAG TPA: hypothetical protein VGN72_21500 [Tepidisphaeraceae bacterium]|jgi:hypothetical protein|nr:hypothetical protein [Tepidisphaeraceae bacterium]
MGADYIPEQDLHAAIWMKSFARQLLRDLAAYRVSQAGADEVADRVRTYRLALVAAREPITRTRAMVLTKTIARRAAERIVRPMAQRLRSDSELAPALKVNLGLRPAKRRVRHVGPPDGKPVLTVVTGRHGETTLTAVHSGHRHRTARPRDTVGLQLFEFIQPLGTAAGDPPGDIELNWRLVGTFTRHRFTVPARAQSFGDRMTFVARWVTRRGETGAFSNPVSTVFACETPIRFDQAPRFQSAA